MLDIAAVEGGCGWHGHFPVDPVFPFEKGRTISERQPHIPVMLEEVLEALSPGVGTRICDATFGAGGYTRALLEAGSDVVAIDRDPSALKNAEALEAQFGERLTLHHGPFSQLEAILAEHEISPLDGIVADIGVSSMQIDQAERGFSFQKDGPLDMRMAQAGRSAADIVNTLEQSLLTRIIGILGEERQAARIAAAIARRREKAPFETTGDLAHTVEGVLGRKPGDRIHPATRTFQALRIFVNDELGELAALCLAAERCLPEGGRFAVVTFHSLEDRLMKRFFADRAGSAGQSRHLPEAADAAPTFRLERKGAIAAGDAEAERNPRSRSAKLRWGSRTAAPARDDKEDVFGLPRFTPSKERQRGGRGR